MSNLLPRNKKSPLDNNLRGFHLPDALKSLGNYSILPRAPGISASVNSLMLVVRRLPRVELRSENPRSVGRRLYSKTNERPEGELYWIRGQQHGPLGRPIPRPVMAEMGGGEIG